MWWPCGQRRERVERGTGMSTSSEQRGAWGGVADVSAHAAIPCLANADMVARRDIDRGVVLDNLNWNFTKIVV